MFAVGVSLVSELLKPMDRPNAFRRDGGREKFDDYARIAVPLRSGDQAWVNVFAS